MDLAIATDYRGEFRKTEDIEACLREIAEAGFSHIHWCFDWTGDYIYSKAEMYQIREWMEKYGLKAKSLHASHGSRFIRDDTKQKEHYRKDYTSDTEFNRIAGRELIENRVELAHIIGATEIVLHMYLPFLDFQEKPETKEVFYRQVFRSLDELEPFCKERNVRICIENLFGAPGELQLEQFDLLFARYPKEFLGFCLDTGHANLVWGDSFVEVLVERYKDRLFSIHMHDNKGSVDEPGGGDAHRLPGEGNIDWKRLMGVLRTSVYELPWTLEVSKPKEEDATAYLKRAKEAGAWMDCQ